MQIDPQIFRAYDIRGIVDQTLTEETVFAIGHALGTKALSSGGDRIVIGRDGRLSGPHLSSQLAKGIMAAGCNVVDVGMVPTPVLYFAAEHLQIKNAVMLTGSHNPVNYNGLKIILDGATIYGKQIQELYTIIKSDNFSNGAGSYQQVEVKAAYNSAIKNNVTINKQLKIVVDSGNGVPGDIAVALFTSLGCVVVPLYCEVDGNFPNHHPDPSDPANLQDLIAAVSEHEADIGLAFDGDGDRLGIIDNNGKIIWSDRALMLFAEDVLRNNPEATIIYDVKCTSDLHAVITAAGGVPLMWNTGHSLIKAKMRETGALLAAEMSGHVFFKDRWYGFDDALYTAARLLEIISATDQTAAQIFARYPEQFATPELSINVTEDNKFAIMHKLIANTKFVDPCEIITLDGLRVEFADGWGLVRPSNTTPKLVVRFEAINQVALERIKADFRKALLAVDAELDISF